MVLLLLDCPQYGSPAVKLYFSRDLFIPFLPLKNLVLAEALPKYMNENAVKAERK